MPPMKYKEAKEHCKAAGYKINVQNSVAFLYVSNEIMKKEIRKNIQFTTELQLKIPISGA